MLSTFELDALRDATSARSSPALFAWFAETRLAGHGLDRRLGGRPGTIADLAAAVMQVASVSPDAAEALVAHRLCIELLSGARNVGLRDHVLPQLLAGERAGAWPAAAMHALAQGHSEPVVALDTGRGFRLTGVLAETANLHAEAMFLPCPVAFGGGAKAELILLSSEQDGIRLDASRGEWTGTARLDGVFFREDELLGGDAPALAQRVNPLARALGCASAQGLAQACVALLPESGATSDLHASAMLARRALIQALNISSTWQSPVLLEHWQLQFLDRAAAALVLAPELPSAAVLASIVARRRGALALQAAATTA